MPKREGFVSGRLNDGAEVTPEQFEFAAACQRKQSRLRRPLHWSEVLAIVEQLGYRKNASPGQLPKPHEDQME